MEKRWKFLSNSKKAPQQAAQNTPEQNATFVA
jgi:hypothetical protein